MSDGLSLRPGLTAVETADGRSVIVRDVWSSRWWRVPAARWRRLTKPATATPTDRQQAAAAGWLSAQRAGDKPWSPMRWISVQTPLMSIQPMAQRLSKPAAVVFHPLAATVWLMFGLWGMAIWLGRGGEMLPAQTMPSPVWLLLTFLVTKTAHELGHAVAAVRMGCQPGKIGLWWIVGAPCPYVDVSSVWMLSSAWRRAVVMGAGMWTEAVLAITALWISLLTGSPMVAAAAVHVVGIAGLATVLFNANPLMRYDGYYLLSDWLDTTDLRQDGKRAWAAWLRGQAWAGPRWLPLYHLAGSFYRVFIQVAIAGMIVHLAGRVGLAKFAVAVILIVAAVRLRRAAVAMVQFVLGRGDADDVKRVVRWGGPSVVMLALIAGLLVPTPRYADLAGVIEPADVRTIYPPAGTRVQQVFVVAGDHVAAGQPLATTTDLVLSLQALRSEVAAIGWRQRIELATQQALRGNNQSGDDLASMRTAAQAVDRQLEQTRQRVADLSIDAPSTGWVLPPRSFPETSSPRFPGPDSLHRVAYGPGQSVTSTPLCRLTDGRRWVALFELPPEVASQWPNRPDVRVSARLQPDRALRPTATEVIWRGSEPTRRQTSRDAASPLTLRCELDWRPPSAGSILPFDRSAASATVHLPPRAAWRDVWAGIKSLVGW